MTARQIFEKYRSEINTHNFDRVESLLSANCRFRFSSGTYNGLQETRSAFEKTWNLIKEEVYTISAIEWICEDTQAAACVYTYHWKGLINGSIKEGTGRGTSCLRNENNAWKICHEHLSAFPT